MAAIFVLPCGFGRDNQIATRDDPFFRDVDPNVVADPAALEYELFGSDDDSDEDSIDSNDEKYIPPLYTKTVSYTHLRAHET